MTRTTNRWQQACAVQQETEGRLKRLIGMGQGSAQRAALARLRRGIGRRPGELPELWGILLDGLPQDMQSHRLDEPSRAEWAIYTALTVFALHQQGRDVLRQSAHVPGVSLGTAAQRLAARLPGELADKRERVARCFNQVATADTMQELAHYLRAFVQLLRANDLALDYALLARDLFCYQFDDGAAGVRLRWGQDFYADTTENKEDADNAQTENGD